MRTISIAVAMLLSCVSLASASPGECKPVLPKLKQPIEKVEWKEVAKEWCEALSSCGIHASTCENDFTAAARKAKTQVKSKHAPHKPAARKREEVKVQLRCEESREAKHEPDRCKTHR
jgi:hypothetical protein